MHLKRLCRAIFDGSGAWVAGVNEGDPERQLHGQEAGEVLSCPVQGQGRHVCPRVHSGHQRPQGHCRSALHLHCMVHRLYPCCTALWTVQASPEQQRNGVVQIDACVCSLHVPGVMLETFLSKRS